MATRSKASSRETMKDKIARLEDMLIRGECQILEITEKYNDLESKYHDSLTDIIQLQRELKELKDANERFKSSAENDHEENEGAHAIMEAISLLKTNLQSQIDTIKSSETASTVSDSQSSGNARATQIPQRLISWPEFDSKNIQIWIEKLDQIKSGFNLDDKAFISTLKLQSNCDLLKRIRLEESKNSSISWLALREQILKWFEPASKTKRAIQMYQRQQSTSESAFSYACDKLDMINRLGETLSDKDKIEMIVAGLQRDERIALTNRSYNDLDDLIRHLHELDSILKRAETGPKKTLIVATKSDKKPDKSSFRKFDKSSSNSPKHGKTNNSKSPSEPSRGDVNKSEVVCHNCWESGHYMKECPKPKFYAIKQMRKLLQNQSQSNPSSDQKN